MSRPDPTIRNIRRGSTHTEKGVFDSFSTPPLVMAEFSLQIPDFEFNAESRVILRAGEAERDPAGEEDETYITKVYLLSVNFRTVGGVRGRPAIPAFRQNLFVFRFNWPILVQLEISLFLKGFTHVFTFSGFLNNGSIFSL